MRFKESISRKLEHSLQQIQMLERMVNGNTVSTTEDAQTVIARTKKLLEEAHRLVYLEKE